MKRRRLPAQTGSAAKLARPANCARVRGALQKEVKGEAMRKALIGMFLAGAAFAPLAVSPALAQSTKDRVEMLEQQVSELKAQAPAATASAVKIGQLEEQIQFLTGRVEELSYKLEQSNARLDAITAALAGDSVGAAGLSTSAGGAAGGPTSLASGDPIADQIARSGDAGEHAGVTDVSLPLDPDAAFDYASSFLMAGDYDRARAAFELYVKAFPNHPRTADAQFRLGEIYLATGANADAADAFIAHIKKYPNDPRSAEAYLKLGTAFSRMEQTTQACKVFKSVRTKFPNASPVVQQRVDVEMTRIKCQ